ncbi:hypothetical protein CMV30_11330 [Nibricoccus aquaticus]|uniref:PEP-CTERM protein-sorting domain-containing protein n=1 Tax=Nibricoccus aquaticus TaxID=2576891 RepID=A0A290QIE5_9BACT|nr:DUF4394 domain-containing protein [Nibricoccus aquaticus]ATC66106.1 hypothetical protein CMV30_11330 [Nibricoccus aquaticus]
MKLSVVSASLLALAGAVSSAHAQFGWAVTTESRLVHFSLSAPSETILSSSITGLRQSNGVTPDAFGNIYELTSFNGQLYGLDGHANFYSINGLSGQATFISNAFAPAGFDAGLAYDPFTGKFRFVSDAGENVQIGLNGAVTNGNATYYAPGDANFGASTVFNGLAIDSDFGTGFALDSATDTLAITFDPNFEEFFTVGSLGFDITGLGSLDILNGALFAALSGDASLSSLYSIDSTTGAATLIGDFGTGVTGLVLTQSAAVPEPSTYGLIGAAALAGLIVLRRRNNRRA